MQRPNRRPSKDKQRGQRAAVARDERRQQRWARCDVCGQHLPIVEETGLCGSCSTAAASTLFGMDADA